MCNIQVITKAGRTHGKKQATWERWNWPLLAEVFSRVDTQSQSQRIARLLRSFQKVLFIPLFSFHPFLCFTLFMSYLISPGGSYRGNTGQGAERVEVDSC